MAGYLRAIRRQLHLGSDVETGSSCAQLVRLLPGCCLKGEQQVEEAEGYVLAALALGPLDLDTLVDQVTECLIRAEIARGGWASDIAIWGPWLYGGHVRRLVRRLDGLLLVVEPRPVRASA